jgi:clan AA aspartic protease (TIGR02281 family)
MKVFAILLFLFCINSGFSQTKIIMKKINGVYTIPCKVNGLSLDFIFDTGASDVSISLTEAAFMLKNGYLKDSDITGSSFAQIANGEITKNTTILIKEIMIADITIRNVTASVIHELKAPLLLGQSAISRLGRIELNGNELIIFSKGSSTYNYSQPTDNISRDNTDYSNSEIVKPLSFISIGSYIYIHNMAPLYSDPSIAPFSKPIIYVEEKYVKIIKEITKNIYKVSTKNQTGYMNKSWFRLK